MSTPRPTRVTSKQYDQSGNVVAVYTKRLELKVWLLEATGAPTDYDEYDAIVVIAASAARAKRLHPREYIWDPKKKVWDHPKIPGLEDTSWVGPAQISATCIGHNARVPERVVLGSFNAG